MTARSCSCLLISIIFVLGCRSGRKPVRSLAQSAAITVIRIGIAGEAVTVPPDILKIQTSAGLEPDWSQERDKAVGRLVELSKSGDPRRLGFLAPPDPRGLVALDPFKNATVQLADLRAYKDGADPETIITADSRLTFPIVAGDKVVSSVTLLRSNGVWIASAYGNATTIRSVMKARIAALSERQGTVLVPLEKAPEYTIVTVPGLNHVFVAARGRGNQLYLVPISTKANLCLTAGVPVRASDALIKLRPAAQKHNGLPT